MNTPSSATHHYQPNMALIGNNPLLLTPKQSVEKWISAAVSKHSQRIDVTFLKATLAGIFLSYGGFLEAVVGGSPSATTNNIGLLKLVEGIVFPVGLTMIIFSETDLLTSSMIIMPLGAIKGRIPWWGVLHNLVVVLLGNMAGSLLFITLLCDYTLLASASSPATSPARDWLVAAATSKVVTLQWQQIFLRAIGCNFMVGSAIYFAGQSSDVVGKIILIFLPILTFAALSFQHIVADMFSIPSGILYGSPATVGMYIGKTMTAAFLGNLVGGLTLGFSLYYIYIVVDDTPETPFNDEAKWALGPYGRNTFKSPFGGPPTALSRVHTRDTTVTAHGNHEKNDC